MNYKPLPIQKVLIDNWLKGDKWKILLSQKPMGVKWARKFYWILRLQVILMRMHDKKTLARGIQQGLS